MTETKTEGRSAGTDLQRETTSLAPIPQEPLQDLTLSTWHPIDPPPLQLPQNDAGTIAKKFGEVIKFSTGTTMAITFEKRAA